MIRISMRTAKTSVMTATTSIRNRDKIDEDRDKINKDNDNINEDIDYIDDDKTVWPVYREAPRLLSASELLYFRRFVAVANVSHDPSCFPHSSALVCHQGKRWYAQGTGARWKRPRRNRGARVVRRVDRIAIGRVRGAV